MPDYIRNYDADQPTVYSEDIAGGHHSVSNLAARDAIPEAKREIGMCVTHIVGGLYYTYRFEGINTLDATWTNSANWSLIIDENYNIDTSNYSFKSDTANYALKGDSVNHSLKSDTSIFSLKSDTANYAINAVKDSTFFIAYIDSIQGLSDADELVIGRTNGFIQLTQQEGSQIDINYDLSGGSGTHYFTGITSLESIRFSDTKSASTFYRASNDASSPSDTTKVIYNGFIQASKFISDTFEINGTDIDTVIELKEAIESTPIDSLTFNTVTKTSHTEAIQWYDTEKHNFQFQNDIDGFTHDLGENNVRVYNNTASTLENGRFVRRTGSYINGNRVPTVEYSGCTQGDSNRVFGMTTTEISPFSYGMVTITGEVNNLVTTGKSGVVYLCHAGDYSSTAPPPPYVRIEVGYVTYTNNDSGSVSVAPPSKIGREKLLIPGSTNVTAIGSYYSHGFYRANATSVTLTNASPTVTFGNANSGYGAHPFIVCGGAGTTDAGVVGLRVTGTSVTDLGTYITSDADTFLTDITTASLNAYFEAIKFSGIVTFELITISGSPTTYSLTINYGYSSYEDNQNKDYWVTGLNVYGRAGANDTGFDMILYKHSATGWTYAASGFVAGGTIIAQRSTDMGAKDNLVNGWPFKWKRTNLSTFIEGSGSEGIVVKYITTANNAVSTVNTHIYTEIE